MASGKMSKRDWINVLIWGLVYCVCLVVGTELYGLAGNLIVGILIVLGTVSVYNLLYVLSSKIKFTENMRLPSSTIIAMNAMMLGFWSEFIFVHHFCNSFSPFLLKLLGFVILLVVACMVSLLGLFVVNYCKKIEC
jgi:hypothetical protein